MASTTSVAAPAASSSSAADTADPYVQATSYKHLHPRRYLDAFLSQGARPDGRQLSQNQSENAWRDVQLNTGSISTAMGSSLVRMGDTTIVCGIKGEVAEVDWERPGEGWIVPNIDLPAISSPQFKPGPPVDEAQVYSQQLSDLLTSSSILPLSSLCIRSGKSAWVLYVDLVCINYDGNVFDAAVLAIMAALRDTQLPVAVWDQDEEKTYCHPTEKRRLVDSLGSLPLSCTFALFDGQYVLPDPTSFETPISSTTLTIAIDTYASSRSNSNDESPIRLLRQTGMGGTKMDGNGLQTMERCVRLAREQVEKLADVLYRR